MTDKSPVLAALESPAYPPLLRVLSVVIVVDVIGFALWSLPALRNTTWSTGSLALLSLAGIGVLWMGWWIVYSRTRLEGDVLSQTWLWNRRAHANEVTQLKLVHLRPLQKIIAPRLLVRRRNGAIAWFHSADPQLLTAFAERVAAQAGRTMQRD
ncbi:hypothetical protein ACSFA3_13150 [Variovorax sp. RHLX14]|uniref:hypothetical protein n=1 Tax=Variovorax sp. RHLX14 TaxID=1259731 RepID=UPI003F48A3F1